MKFLLLILLAVTASAQVMIPPGPLVSYRRPVAAGGSALLTSLDAYWKLDEASGTRNDSVGANHLTDNNTVTSASGKISTAAVFTGANSESLSIADNAALSTDGKSWTFACWVQPYTTNTTEDIASKYDASGTAREWAVYRLNNSRIEVAFSPDGTSGSVVLVSSLGAEDVKPPTNTYSLVVAVVDASALKLRLAVGTASGVTWFTNSITAAFSGTGTAPFRLGFSQRNSTYLDGSLDEAGFWSRALSSSDVTELYNSYNGKTHPFN